MLIKAVVYLAIGLILSIHPLYLAGVKAAESISNIPHAVVLMYHRFGESSYPSTNITIEQFETQLDYLKKNNFTVLPLDTIIEAVRSGSPLPDKTVAITVDDAYRSVYEIAYPRLQAANFPFTVFIATEGVDKNIPAFMSWDQVREMHNNGVLFANHTTNHAYLVRKKHNESDNKWQKRVTMTIQEAQKRIIEELGSAPMLFAYPYGEYSRQVMDIVTSLGYTGFGQHSGGIGQLSDMRALPRFPMAEQFASLDSFKVKVNSLPLPVTNVSPLDPMTNDNHPELTVTLSPGEYNLDQLACYSNNEPMKLNWLKEGKEFSIQSASPLPAGRGRYNCTAPHSEKKKYYWFSHPWIVSEEQ